MGAITPIPATIHEYIANSFAQLRINISNKMG